MRKASAEFVLKRPQAVSPPPLNEEQTAALQAFLAGEHVLVSGSAGSGLSTLAKTALRAVPAPTEKATDHPRTPQPTWQAPLLVVPTRFAQARMEKEIRDYQPIATRSARQVRTPASLAFEIIGQFCQERALPKAPPRLMTSAEIDAALAALIAGDEGDEVAEQLSWPQYLSDPETRNQAPIREQLAAALELANELELKPENLIAAAQQTGFSSWETLAQVMRRFSIPDLSEAAAESYPDRILGSAALVVATHLIQQWERLVKPEGLKITVPHPAALVVDEVQDFSPAALKLIEALAAETPLLVTFNPHNQVGTYRGAPQYSVAELKRTLNAQHYHLQAQLRPTGVCRATANELARRIGGEIPVSSSSSSAPPAADKKDLSATFGPDTATSLQVKIAAETELMYGYIAQQLQQELYLERTPAHKIALIVRSNAQINELRVGLRKYGIATKTAQTSIDFRSHPVTATVLRLMAGELSFQEIFCSVLLKADHHLYQQLLRDLSSQFGLVTDLGLNKIEIAFAAAADNSAPPGISEEPNIAAPPETAPPETAPPETAPPEMAPSSETAAQPNAAAQPEVSSQTRNPSATDLEPVLGCDLVARIQATDNVERALEYLANDPRACLALAEARRDSAAGPAYAAMLTAVNLRAASRGDANWGDEITPAQAFNAIWQAAQCEESWVNAALAGEGWADEYLDAAVALSRHIDLWQQANPRGTATQFAAEKLATSVPVSNLASGGAPQEAIEVLTATQAAGREYELVILPFMQDGTWPSRHPNEGIFHPSLLQYVRYEHIPNNLADDRVLLEAHLRSELQLLGSALTRASGKTIITAVDDEYQSPSRIIALLKTLSTLQSPIEVAQGVAAMGYDSRTAAAQLRKKLIENRQYPALVQEYARLLSKLANLDEDSDLDYENPADPRTWSEVTRVSSDSEVVPIGTPVKLSPSKIKPIIDCPLQAFLQQQAQSEKTFNLQLGNVVHKLAELYGNALVPVAEGGKDMSAAELEAVMQAHAEEILRDPQLRTETFAGLTNRKALEDSLQVLRKYLVENPRPALLEKRFKFENEAWRISGIIDRIDFDQDGQAVIVDYKTGAHSPAKDDTKYNLQLSTYQLLWRESAALSPKKLPQKAAQVASAMLLYLRNANTSRPYGEIVQDALKPCTAPVRTNLLAHQLPPPGRHFALLSEAEAEGMTEELALTALHTAANSIRGKKLQAIPGSGCESCAFRKICPTIEACPRTLK